jgi:hypothetical protein
MFILVLVLCLVVALRQCARETREMTKSGEWAAMIKGIKAAAEWIGIIYWWLTSLWRWHDFFAGECSTYKHTSSDDCVSHLTVMYRGILFEQGKTMCLEWWSWRPWFATSEASVPCWSGPSAQDTTTFVNPSLMLTVFTIVLILCLCRPTNKRSTSKDESANAQPTRNVVSEQSVTMSPSTI